MNPSLVSVIMPAYNGEQFIKQAIESVLSQEYPHWELIVVDDGSTDMTPQVVSNLRDTRIVYIYQVNCGQAAALNHGLDVARGEYITTLDVDDWFTPNSLGDRVAFLDSYQEYDVVYGDGIFCDKDGNQLKRFSELRSGDVTGDVFDVMLSNSFFGTGANVMVRKSALEQNHIRYDESIVWCQDYDLYLRLAEKFQFGYVDSITVWYRLHQANMTMMMPTGRRLESLVRTKIKVLNSPRFVKTQYPYSYLFFRDLILHDLDNRMEDQIALLDHPGFSSLPRSDQAKLIRLLASGYLSLNQKTDEVKMLLMRSWRLNVFDLKTVLAAFFAHFRRGPIGPLFRYWQKMKLRNSFVPSPFDHIQE